MRSQLSTKECDWCSNRLHLLYRPRMFLSFMHIWSQVSCEWTFTYGLFNGAVSSSAHTVTNIIPLVTGKDVETKSQVPNLGLSTIPASAWENWGQLRGKFQDSRPLDREHIVHAFLNMTWNVRFSAQSSRSHKFIIIRWIQDLAEKCTFCS
jgi:hypothetical protein